MIRTIVNWLRGYLWVRIHGVSPERFINLCSNKRIFLWNIQKVDEDYLFYISVKDFKNLKPIARKTGLYPRIIQKYGFPFILRRYKKRKSFFIGVLICSCLIYLMSLFIWEITIEGGSKYTPEAMIKFLKEIDVYTGIRKKAVNAQEIEEQIRLTYNDIGWVSAEIRGTRLIIKITETNMPAPAAKAMEPSHIVAAKNGIIQEIITRAGTPMVKVGDVVKKGDILVSGVVDVLADFETLIEKQPVVADADIISKTYYDYNDQIPMKYIERQYTGKKKTGYRISFFDGKIFLYNPRYSYDKYDIIIDENVMHLTESFYLPFRYGKVIVREYKEVNRTYTEEEAITIAKARLKRYFDKLIENDVAILENNVKITIQNNSCIAQGKIIVEEPAWEYKTIQESEWRIEETDEHSGDDN